MKTPLLPTLLAMLTALFALVTPGEAFARHGEARNGPPPGRITVVNQSGGDLTLTIGYAPPRSVRAWDTVTFTVGAGETTVRASYMQFGADRMLSNERVYVTPSRTSTVTIAPERTARLLVTNDAPYEAELLVDGRSRGRFSAGESRLVTLGVGRAELAMVGGGRTLDRTTLDLVAFAERSWRAEAPRTGDLVVVNPLPIPIQLVCAKGLVRDVAPYGQAVYRDLPAGEFRLTARRVTGETIDLEVARIPAGGSDTWRVDVPRTGFVALDSDHALDSEVRIDGRTVARIAAGAVRRIEASVGWHEVEIVDARGVTLARTWMEVEPFDVAQMSFGGQRSRGREHDHRGHDHDRDQRAHRGERSDAVVASSESCGMP